VACVAEPKEVIPILFPFRSRTVATDGVRHEKERRCFHIDGDAADRETAYGGANAGAERGCIVDFPAHESAHGKARLHENYPWIVALALKMVLRDAHVQREEDQVLARHGDANVLGV
jgi:hypothetical protein